MDLREYVRLLRRRWLSVLIIAVAVPAATMGMIVLMTPKYTASTELFFAARVGETPADLAQGSTYTEQQMGSYAKVAVSPLVLDPVISSLGLEVSAQDLAEVVSAEAVPSTVILHISVTDPDAQQAGRLANAIGKQLTVVADRLAPVDKDGSSALSATILTPALTPNRPSSPAVGRYLAVALLLGLLLGVGYAVLQHLLDTRIRNEQDVKGLTDTPILGVVPMGPRRAPSGVVLRDDPMGARAGALRRLRINLSILGAVEEQKPIVISSSVAEEGKTETAVNLAVTAADAGLRVILVDADLRHPQVAARLGLPDAAGLSSVLLGQADAERVVQRWQHSNLHVLTAGPRSADSAEFLGSGAMTTLLNRLSARYDLVLIDTPPLLPVPDAITLTRSAAGMLLVVGVDRLRRPQLLDTLQSLTTVNAKVIGLVLNKVARRDVDGNAFGRQRGLNWDLTEEAVKES